MSNSKLRAWIEASRLRTLPLSLACIFLGSFLAASSGTFRFDIFGLSVLTTIFLQVLSNLANDYGDSIHGADSKDRQGPMRMVQQGLISSVEMKKGVILLSALSFVSGLTLLFISFQQQWMLLLIFLLLGLLSIAAAISYTATKKPYGYKGLGDLAVLIFFGFIGVGGTYFLQVKTIDPLILLPAAACGLFATGVLNINNIRDIDSDRKAGKISIPVRLGRERAVIYHCLILATGIVLASIFTFLREGGLFQWLFLLSVPLFVVNAKAIVSKKDPGDIDPYLKQLSLSTLFFVITFGVGLMLSI